MKISSALFIKSAPALNSCPEPNMPEYAFIGRSNVGKSSLINMLTAQKGLAKTSSTPGKTQYINFFLINDSFYWVDLPGLGYAKTSKTNREKWEKNTTAYLLKRRNLLATFLLIDCRISPQKIDIDFMTWLAENQLPFVIVFTKIDKLSKNQLEINIASYKKTLLESWEELPPLFLTSSEKNIGKEDILSFVNETNEIFHT